jgi:hypothetical protein
VDEYARERLYAQGGASVAELLRGNGQQQQQQRLSYCCLLYALLAQRVA